MLLDTHVLLWLLTDDERLGPHSRGHLGSAPAVHVSAASLWEIAIKAELGRLRVPESLPELVEEAGLHWLPIAPSHAWSIREIADLPHRDPFDRLLAAQARFERMPLLTADRTLLAAAPSGVTTVDARQ
jgi:PIN domain nuclease of toxin-antitoxin system